MDDLNIAVAALRDDVACLITDVANRDAEIKRLQAGIFLIMAAARDGQICDDVVWFDDHQTLWEHCAWLNRWEHGPDKPLPTDPPMSSDRSDTKGDDA